jgi:hypothetical protein
LLYAPLRYTHHFIPGHVSTVFALVAMGEAHGADGDPRLQIDCCQRAVERIEAHASSEKEKAAAAAAGGAGAGDATDTVSVVDAELTDSGDLTDLTDPTDSTDSTDSTDPTDDSMLTDVHAAALEHIGAAHFVRREWAEVTIQCISVGVYECTSVRV